MRLVRWWVWVGAGLLLTLVVVNCKGDDGDKVELVKSQELPRNQEKLSWNQEEFPNSHEELSITHEELPRSQEKLSRNQEFPNSHEELSMTQEASGGHIRGDDVMDEVTADDVMDEVTASPPVTPPSPRQTGEEILLSLCPPKGSTPLQV